MITWLLMLAQTNDLIDKARLTLAADRGCDRVADSTDITVCGLRRADRYRVPLIEHDPGDPRYEGVPAERERLLHRTTPVQDLSPFLVGGGMVGAHTTISAAGTRVATLRPLAP